MRPEYLALLATARGVTGRAAQGRGGKPGFTIADLAGCMAQLEPRFCDAFMYRYAGDDSTRARLRGALNERVTVISRSWSPRQVSKATELVDIVLDEERLTLRQRTDVVRAAMLGVHKSSWYRTWDRPHGEVQGELESWIGTAYRTILRRLRLY